MGANYVDFILATHGIQFILSGACLPILNCCAVTSNDLKWSKLRLKPLKAVL